MTTSPILILLILGLAVVAFLVWKLTQKFQAYLDGQKNDQVAQIMNQNLQAMHARLDKAAKFFSDLSGEMKGLQDMKDNFRQLQVTLLSPKMRGNFGEQVLGTMLETHFPKEQFELQYKFKSGETVDAVIKTRDGIIPVDSKFPLENFRKMVAAQTPEERASEQREFFKAVKKHIGDIAKKYVLPGEGTTAFAVMYVPSEGIFYEIISASDELAEYAMQHKVLMTSPNTMSYFLLILRQGLERIRIEQNVQKVWEMLSGFQQDAVKFSETLSVLSRHVTNAKNQVDAATADFGLLASKIDQIKQLK